MIISIYSFCSSSYFGSGWVGDRYESLLDNALLQLWCLVYCVLNDICTKFFFMFIEASLSSWIMQVVSSSGTAARKPYFQRVILTHLLLHNYKAQILSSQHAVSYKKWHMEEKATQLVRLGRRQTIILFLHASMKWWLHNSLAVWEKYMKAADRNVIASQSLSLLQH